MPRIVDHAARRAELAATALGIVRESGVESLSVRTLAAASGWSSGALRHYVTDVDALAQLMLDEVSGRVQKRVTAVLRDGVPPQRATTIVIECLEQVLPIDEERSVEFAVARHYWGKDRDGPEAEWVWTGQRMFYRQMVLLLHGAGPEMVPQLPEAQSPNLEQWAGHLHAFIDGLALRAAVSVPTVSASEVREDLSNFVDVIAHHQVRSS